MKLKKIEREPLFRNTVWWSEDLTDEDGESYTVNHTKDTPKIKSERRLQLELKELKQPPKKGLEEIIVPPQATQN